MFMQSIQDRLRALRERRGLTQLQIAQVMGKSKSHISRVEAGVTGVHLQVVESYLAALDLHLEAVPNAEPTGEEVAAIVATMDPAHRTLIADLARVMPNLPEALIDELRRQATAWAEAYGRGPRM